MLLSLVSKTSSKKWATMIELMAMIVILWLGISGMFSVVTWGMYFAKDTEDTIKAINIAREWIEWVTNIRNTNWLRFSSDRANCWKVLDYSSTCIGSSSPSTIMSGSNLLYSRNGLWYLSGVTNLWTPTAGAWTTYYNRFKTIQESDWFINQTWSVSYPQCDNITQNNCQTIFTREMIIGYDSAPSGSWIITVKSVVYWNTKRLQKVELSTTLTNWKSKF